MALLVFNSKLVGTNGGILEYSTVPSTYFKLDITSLQSGSIMQLSELEFYDENGNKLNVVYVAGTPGTSSDYGDENPPNMFDGRTDTKWCVRSSSSFVIGKVTGTAEAASYRMATANDTASNPGRNPKTWTISRATSLEDITTRDSSLWTVIDTRTNDSTMTGVNETFFSFAIQQPIQQTMAANSTRTLKSTGRGLTFNSAKGNTGEPVKSEDMVWEEQEEPSLGSGGY